MDERFIEQDGIDIIVDPGALQVQGKQVEDKTEAQRWGGPSEAGAILPL
jgi:hypothetical protein